MLQTSSGHLSSYRYRASAYQVVGLLQGNHYTGRAQAVDLFNVRHDQHLGLRLAGAYGVEMDSCIKCCYAYLYCLVACTGHTILPLVPARLRHTVRPI